MRFFSFFKKHKIFIVVALFIIAWSILLFLIDPQTIVQKVGIKNSYLIIFFFAALGGVSTFTSTPFYATVLTFSAGGLNPVLISLSAVPGLVFGDYIFYFFGKKGKDVIRDYSRERFDKVVLSFKNKPKWLVRFITYIYTGLTPLPGDLLMLALAFTGYRFRDMLVFIMLGHFTFMLALSISGDYGIGLLFSSAWISTR